MPQFGYCNPITSGAAMSMRDHCIVRSGNHWYMTGTSHPIWQGPNPGVCLWKSADLLNWSRERWLIDAKALPAGSPYLGRFWAPEIHVSAGRFYLTVNCGHTSPADEGSLMTDHNIWLFVAERITGPYQLLNGPLSVGFKNDATLFTDQDGRSYCYCSGGGLWQAEIDLGTGVPKGDFARFCSPKDPDIPDWMIGGIEGPFVIKRRGIYFMLFSAWTRGYEIGVLRATSPLGPWTLQPDSPIFGTRKRRFREQQMIEAGYAHVTFQDTADPYVETGHCAVFEGPDGKDWLCCHYFLEGRNRSNKGSLIEYEDAWPELGIEPLHFDGDRLRIDGPTWTPQAVRWLV